MRDLRVARAAHADFPDVVLVHQGTVEEGDRFFDGRWPEVRALADPERRLYEVFGIGRGALGQILNPRVVARAVGAMLGGSGVGKAVGDVRVMPGAFLIHRGRVVWRHDPRHVADQPDLEEVRRVATRAVERASSLEARS